MQQTKEGAAAVSTRKAPRPGLKSAPPPSPRAAPVERIERRKVSELIPYARNPKTHPPEQVNKIADSMERWGQAQLIVVDERGEIIAGHGRILAAEQLGWPEVVVGIASGWTEAEKRAYRIADNELGSERSAPYNLELLKSEISDLRTQSFEMGLLGFEMVEINGKMIIRGHESASEFLDGFASGEETVDESTSVVATPRGISLRLDMLPAERDIVIEFLAKERDRRKLRTTAEALVAVAKEALKGKR